MKKRLFLAAMVLLAPIFAIAQSQGDMNADADKEYRKADQELNAVYQRVLREYGSDTAFIRRFKASQRIWIQLRDAEMMTRYPDESGRLAYGSVFPMCWSIYMTTLTKERSKHLRTWITGIEEGDVCSGSVRVK